MYKIADVLFILVFDGSVLLYFSTFQIIARFIEKRYGTLFDLEGYKHQVSNKYKKWMVSYYMERPILYAHLIWNHFNAAFLRYGTLIHSEEYKDPIFNKYKKWMVSSYMGRPILYALLIWNHFTAAFLRYGTLIHFKEL